MTGGGKSPLPPHSKGGAMDGTTSAIAGKRGASGKGRLAKSHDKALFYALLLPAFILVTLFIIWPVVNTVFYSFYDWNGFGPLKNFVGLKNLRTLLRDSLFWNALRNNGIVIAFSVFVQLPIAFLLALLVSRSTSRMTIFFRTVFFLPYILSEIITGVIWRFIYHPQFGLLKQVFAALAPNYSYTGFLADPNTVFVSILFVIFWKYFGFHMILYVAGLQGIPPEYHEAALIDGANPVQAFIYVTLPFMKNAIQMSLFFCIIGSLQVFDVIWSMGQGGPVHAAETAVVYLYKFGIKSSKMGFGSMVAIVIFVICLAFNVLYQRVINREDNR
jgi:raffinose/stachyose/melibiose transport system permease protein